MVSCWPDCEALRCPPYGRNKRQSGHDADIVEGPSLCRFLDAGDLKASRTLDRTASKKHQGTKSRLVVRRRIGVRYGDLKAARSLGNLRGGGCDAGAGAAVR